MGYISYSKEEDYIRENFSQFDLRAWNQAIQDINDESKTTAYTNRRIIDKQYRRPIYLQLYRRIWQKWNFRLIL